MGRRPDREHIARNASVVFGGAGETATVRSYVSGATGTPKFGVATTFLYNERVITALFASTLFGAPRPTERAQPGGQTQMADLMITTESALGTQDEIVWRGSAYRAAGAAMPQVVGGRLSWRMPLVLAART